MGKVFIHCFKFLFKDESKGWEQDAELNWAAKCGDLISPWLFLSPLTTLCDFIFVGLLEPTAAAPTGLGAQPGREGSLLIHHLVPGAWLGAWHIVGA